MADESEQRLGAVSGRYGAWRQVYVGESVLGSPGEETLACEVELVVRDLLLIEDVVTEEVTCLLCYELEKRGTLDVAVYTLIVILRGKVKSHVKEDSSFVPSVASLVHRLVYSQDLPVCSQEKMVDAYAELRDLYDKQSGAVRVEQFYVGPLVGKVMSRVMWDRGSSSVGFRRSRKWVDCLRYDWSAVGERKRRFQDGGEVGGRGGLKRNRVDTVVWILFGVLRDVTNLFIEERR